MGNERERNELEGRIRRHMGPLAGAHGTLEPEGRIWHRRVETVPVPVVTTSPAGTVVWANRAAGKMFNMPAELLAGRPLAAFVQPGDQGRFDELRAAALTSSQPLSAREFSVTPRRRKAVPVLAAVACEPPGYSSETGDAELCWSLTDVSDLKRSERALGRTIVRLERIMAEQAGKLDVAAGRVADAVKDAERNGQRVSQAHAMLDLALAISDHAVFTVDADGFVASWNEGAERLFGRDSADAVGKPLGSVIEAATIEDVRDAAHAGRRKITWLPAVGCRRDGSTWKAAWSVRDASTPDTVLYVCAVRRDVNRS